MNRLITSCIMCKKKLVGRSDKKFCSLDCKNEYHQKLRAVTQVATQSIDRILHRNRSILLELMGKNKTQMKIDRKLLDRKNFKYNYITGYYVNARGKTYHYVYDFSWMEFSDREILINRRRKKNLSTV